MSWIDNIKTDLVIETGDGNKFTPDWLNASKAVEYNLVEFDFPNIPGTLVKRSQPRGRKYNLEIYFKGDDHLELSNDFEKSANDSRAWTISHPFYDRIIVQPVSLAFDNTRYNTTKITGVIIETITEDNPKTTVAPQEKISADKEVLDATFEDSFANDVVPDTDDINTLTENTATFHNTGLNIASETIDAEDYFNLFNAANAAILNATAEPLAAIRALQAVINAPALFAQSVKNRITVFVEQITKLSSGINEILTPNNKKIYENNVGVGLSAMALASSNPQQDDYDSRSKVLEIIDEINRSYNAYLADLDTLQTLTGGDEDSYIPDAEALIGLNNLINFTLSNLFDIALESKQERSVILEDDSNIILLTHRFYGLEADDSTIDSLMEINNIGLNEILNIRKGRKLIYLV
ncbi:hypothetical protein LCGC14_0593520 [marine sediment metagenome]|uniref:DNA circulation N-terminal domain-containing protein n=1 Tax=marine sediment metagenome TaxID=412755 RepID=A0A0F9RWH2_9ZZZZ